MRKPTEPNDSRRPAARRALRSGRARRHCVGAGPGSSVGACTRVRGCVWVCDGCHCGPGVGGAGQAGQTGHSHELKAIHGRAAAGKVRRAKLKAQRQRAVSQSRRAHRVLDTSQKQAEAEKRRYVKKAPVFRSGACTPAARAFGPSGGSFVSRASRRTAAPHSMHRPRLTARPVARSPPKCGPGWMGRPCSYENNMRSYCASENRAKANEREARLYLLGIKLLKEATGFYC